MTHWFERINVLRPMLSMGLCPQTFAALVAAAAILLANSYISVVRALI